MKPTVSTVTDHQGVTTITLDRPEKRNAFDDQMIAELTAAFFSVSTDSKTRAVILTAAGAHFSAGADLQWMKHMGSIPYEENLEDAKQLVLLLTTLDQMPVPTIARIQGPAFGGALGLISCCDIAIASTEAVFCFSEVKIGLIPATISPYIIRAMGERHARRYFTTAEPFKAQRALSLGLIHEVVDSSLLDTTVTNTVEAILNNSPTAMAEVKRLIRDIGEQPINERIHLETCQRLAKCRLSEEGQEGLSAFFEKRRPNWQNKG